MDDLISRKAAIEAINGMIDRFERLLADIRESKVDDSVCGMCEYDGAYIGQSGDWCNECPGFERDDCFKLSDKTRKEWTDEIIKALPSAQPERVWTPCDIPPEHHRDVIVRGIEAIGGNRVYKVMQWDDDTWRPTDYAPSIMWLDWSEI